MNGPNPHLLDLVEQEYQRQSMVIQLIASENLPSPAVYQILRYPLLCYKTAEGKPHKRYHSGCYVIDDIEEFAIEKAKELFGSKYANVQPVTATNANHAAFKALADADSRILALDISCGGHISHNLQFKNIFHYFVDPISQLFDYDEIRRIAKEVKPHLIIAGSSAYPREIDFKIFRSIADEVGAYLLADIAHIAGLVAAKIHNSPVNYAHVTTASTYKTLRGPRAGLILSGDDCFLQVNGDPLYKKIDKALFPGVQSSPNLLTITAEGVCFDDSLTQEFQSYARQVVENSRALSTSLQSHGHCIISGGTDTHIVMLDVSKIGLSGVVAEKALEETGILTNRNQVPYDKSSPQTASGLRLGTSFATSRGMTKDDMVTLGGCIDKVLRSTKALSDTRYQLDDAVKASTRYTVIEMAKQYPLFMSMKEMDSSLSARLTPTQPY